MKMAMTRALGALALTLAWVTAPAQAQQAPTDQTLEKIEVTGSSIRRIESEGALPVTTITRDAIEKSGVTTVTDLIQSLPAMTGGNFQQASSSVNGNGNGETTAAIHGLDQKYTLVLLNGRRIAPFGGFGSGGLDGSVNLSSLPLDAIERVEVLTDGASALYGSDAIAGVVNFITKKNTQEGTAFFNQGIPVKGGGQNWSAGVSKGFGDLGADGYNVLLSYSHDYQQRLRASERAVSARGGLIPYSVGGNSGVFDQTSGNSLPGTIFLDQSGAGFNPYFNKFGNCGPSPYVFASAGLCRTNYAAMVDDVPTSERDSVFLSARYRLNDSVTLFGEGFYSRYDMKATFAPPAQPMGLGGNDLPGQPLNIIWQKYVVPYLAANHDPSTSGQMTYRAMEAGGRADDWITTAKHLVLGADGSFRGWDYSGSYVISTNEDRDNLAGGYLDFNQFVNLIASGQYDPILPIPGQSLNSALLSGTFLRTLVMQKVLSARASTDLFALPGGNSSLGLGAEFTSLNMKQEPNNMAEFGNGTPAQLGATDYAVGGFYGYMPMAAKRNNYGTFAELLMPLQKRLEFTASVRFDAYDKVHNDAVYSSTPDQNNLIYPLPAADQGNTFNATTFKLSFKAQPVDEVMLRGSFGSGFKAPSIPQIASNLAFSTNTSGSYVCPFPGTTACNPFLPPQVPKAVANQWDLLTQGNAASGAAGLKAETSRQWTIGGRYEPVKAFSIGADYWSVKLNNQILPGIPEGTAFNNVAQYASYFVNPYRDPSGPITVALKQIPFNSGRSESSGIDWDLTVRVPTMFGALTTDVSGTHMLKQRYQLGGGWQSDLGQFGGDNNVVFRDQGRAIASLHTGDFTNTLTLNYKSGYQDQDVGLGFINQVSSYKTADWQTRYDLNKNVRGTLGLKNIFNSAPPLSYKLVGGNQVGYDGRYADPIGRTIEAGVSVKF